MKDIRYIFTFDDGTSLIKDVAHSGTAAGYRRGEFSLNPKPLSTYHRACMVVSIDLDTLETKVLKNRYGCEGSVTPQVRGQR